MRKVSIYSLQQQVRTFRGEYREIPISLQRGNVLPYVSNLYRPPPWGLSVPVPFFFFLRLVIHPKT